MFDFGGGGIFDLLYGCNYSDPSIDFLFCRVINILNATISALIIVATVVFMWGIIQYVIAGPSEKKAEAAKTYITYGILGLVIMVSVWAFVNILINTLFGTSPLDAPFDPFEYQIRRDY